MQGCEESKSRSVVLQCLLKKEKSLRGRKGSTLIHIHISIHFTMNSLQLFIHFEESLVRFQEHVQSVSFA